MMRDPNEDTEWNDLLRKFNILPEKKPDPAEQELTEMMERTIEERQTADYRLGSLGLEELAEVEDDEDEAVIMEYRRKRLAELKAEMQLNKFGEVVEISAQDYVEKVNKAGTGVWVFLHLYKSGIPLCTLINQYFVRLAAKYPKGQMKKQFIGPLEFGGEKLQYEALEWMLSDTGAFKTDLEEDPRKPKVKDVLLSVLHRNADSDEDSDDNDW